MLKVIHLALLLTALLATNALAQETPPAAVESPAAAAPATQPAADMAEYWNDFVHYVRIGRADAALANAKAIVEAKAEPRVIYGLSNQTTDVSGTLDRAEKLGETQPGLADAVKAIRQMIEDGFRQESRDPAEISRTIDMLARSTREYRIGVDRLKRSGEYAMPQLISRLGDPQTTQLLRDRLVTVLPEMGKDAVRPLCEALQSSNPVVRNTICQALGRIGYPHAAPYLRAEVDKSEQLPELKASALAALVAVTDDPAAAAKPLAGYYYALADGYYKNSESLRPDPRYDVANVWFWKDGALSYQEVATPIFMDIYAMRIARMTLVTDGSYEPAVSLWLAAYLRREAHLPAGATDPLKPAQQLSAAAYAKAAGARYAQQVLSRALNDGDGDVAVGIIPPLADIAGARNLLQPVEGGATPLVAAMSFSSRLVRFLAMEALINANPQEQFAGADLAMQVAVEALRQTGKQSALLIEPNAETRNKLKDAIRAAGYEVTDGENYASAIEAAGRGTGVDVVVVTTAVREPGARQTLAMLRTVPAYATVPVVIVAGEADVLTVRSLEREDNLLTVIENTGAVADALKKAATQAAETLSQEESTRWALRAAKGLEMLGQTRNPVFKITLAQQALIDNLAAGSDELKIACAAALAVQPGAAPQQALAGLALSEVPDPVRLAALQSTAKSVRLIGNQLTEAQATSVVQYVQSTASQQLRDAASQLLGAMNLSSDKIKGMITATAGSD